MAACAVRASGPGRPRAMPSGAGSATPRSPASSSSMRSLAKLPSDLRITIKNTFIDVDDAGGQAQQERSLHQTGARTCAARFSTGITPRIFPQGIGAETPAAEEAPHFPPTQPALVSTTPAEIPAFPGAECPQGPGAAPPPDLQKEGAGSGRARVLLQVPLELDAALAAMLPEAPRCLGVQLMGSSADAACGHVIMDLRVMLAMAPGASPPSGPTCPLASTSRPPAPSPVGPMSTGTPPSESSQGSPSRRRLVCCHWKNKGWCRYQDNCKFLHPLHKRGVGPVGAKSSRSTPMSKVSSNGHRR